MYKDEVCAALMDLGVVVALNLDGGGSTTTWYARSSLPSPLPLLPAFSTTAITGVVPALTYTILDPRPSPPRYEGDYANRPTCVDYVAPSCERTVASVLCVMP